MSGFVYEWICVCMSFFNLTFQFMKIYLYIILPS